MGKFVVCGGKRLCGEVFVSGSKNAALPIIFASLITHGVSEIRNLPKINDVKCALSIIENFGAKVYIDADSCLIDTTDLCYARPSDSDVSQLRASTYLIGACLGRFGRAELQRFGGCAFSFRPIDMHISAALDFGAVEGEGVLLADSLHPADIVFARKSVGATVNALIMAAATKGESRIYGYAEEPHIISLMDYLISAGASIRRQEDCLTVSGGGLCGGSVRIGGDMIEAGSFLCASLLTGGDVFVRGFDPEELSSFFSVLSDAGVRVELYPDGVRVSGAPDRRMCVVTEAYPGFPTDLQPIFAALQARFCGGSIRETVWQGRFGYLTELAKLGVSYRMEGDGVEILPSRLQSGVLRAVDLRGGAAAILLALAIDGRSEINSGEIVLRGYERLCEKITSLGGEIFFDFEM